MTAPTTASCLVGAVPVPAGVGIAVNAGGSSMPGDASAAFAQVLSDAKDAVAPAPNAVALTAPSAVVLTAPATVDPAPAPLPPVPEAAMEIPTVPLASPTQDAPEVSPSLTAAAAPAVVAKEPQVRGAKHAHPIDVRKADKANAGEPIDATVSVSAAVVDPILVAATAPEPDVSVDATVSSALDPTAVTLSDAAATTATAMTTTVTTDVASVQSSEVGRVVPSARLSVSSSSPTLGDIAEPLRSAGLTSSPDATGNPGASLPAILSGSAPSSSGVTTATLDSSPSPGTPTPPQTAASAQSPFDAVISVSVTKGEVVPAQLQPDAQQPAPTSAVAPQDIEPVNAPAKSIAPVGIQPDDKPLSADAESSTAVGSPAVREHDRVHTQIQTDSASVTGPPGGVTDRSDAVAVAHQIGRHIAASRLAGVAREHPTHLSVLLHPEDLGEVSVQLTLVAGRIDVQVSSQSDTTRDLLRQGMQDLRRQLSDSGVSVGDMDVHDGWNQQPNSSQNDQQSADQRGSQQSRLPGLPAPSSSRMTTPEPTVVHRQSRTGLDILA